MIISSRHFVSLFCSCITLTAGTHLPAETMGALGLSPLAVQSGVTRQGHNYPVITLIQVDIPATQYIDVYKDA